ncbi:MAG: Hpt domain-containing protein, partial [Litorimonas sp.]
MDEIQEIFFLECADLMADLHGRLAVVESGESDMEDLNAIFRAVHSIKGGAGSFDLPQLVGFSHIFENVLDMLRSGTVAVDEDVIPLLMQSADVLTDLVDGAQSGVAVAEDSYAPTLQALESFSAENGAGEAEDEEEFVFQPVGVGAAPLPMDLPGLPPLAAPLPALSAPNAGLSLKFAPLPTLYKSGLNSFRLLDDLIGAGATNVVLHDADVPDMGGLDGHGLADGAIALHWTMSFPPSVTRDEIEDLMFFAGDKCVMEFTQRAAEAEADAVPAEDPLAQFMAPPGLP